MCKNHPIVVPINNNSKNVVGNPYKDNRNTYKGSEATNKARPTRGLTNVKIPNKIALLMVNDKNDMALLYLSQSKRES
jgi:hypothetical protein